MWSRAEAETSAGRALALWEGFPVGADPRPLVLTGETVLFHGGFPTSEAKIAFLGGIVEAAADVEVPQEVLGALASRPRVTPYRPSANPVRVIGARLSHAEFATDRGLRLLPAWHLDVADVTEPFLVLDPAAVDEVWPAAAETMSDMCATSDSEGRVLTVEFIGSPERYTDYPEVIVLETATAVAILPVPVERQVSGFRTLQGQRREVVATLAEPLGARVLVDYRSGAAVPVEVARPIP